MDAGGRLKGRSARPLAADYDGAVIAIGFEDGMVSAAVPYSHAAPLPPPPS